MPELTEDRPYNPPIRRHDDAVQTYLENWPNELRSLSIPQVDIPMTREEATALDSQIIDWGEAFAEAPIPAHSLVAKVEAACARMPGPYFVRLGSRSPKDAFYWPKDELKAENADEVLQLLTAGSERVYEDLKIGLHFNYEPHIFIRQWIDIPEWAEFRCFMKDRKLIAVSQYYYRKVHRQILDEWDGIQWSIEQFFNRQFRHASHLDSVVFDVFVRLKGNATYNSACCGNLPWRNWEVKLLEINPYWNLTDPCLFSWDELAKLEAAHAVVFPQCAHTNVDWVSQETGKCEECGEFVDRDADGKMLGALPKDPPPLIFRYLQSAEQLLPKRSCELPATP